MTLALVIASMPHTRDNNSDTNQPLQAPQRPQSPNSQFNELWNFLNKDLKKKFHVCSDIIQKQETLRARSIYLENCLTKKLIPPSMKIKRTFSQKLSEKGKQQLENNYKSIELSNLRIIIKEIKSEQLALQEKLQQSKGLLLGHCIQEEQNAIENILEKRRNQFFVKATKKFDNKIEFQHRKSNKPSSLQEGIIENEAREGNTERTKKTRRFIKRSKYRRKLRKWGKKKLEPIYTNYSDHILTEHEKKVLSKHTSFSPLPEKVNKTQLQYEMNIFSRHLKWGEHFNQNDFNSDKSKPIFQIKKHNLPDHPPSRTLSNFIYGVESDLLSLPMKKVRQNLTMDERKSVQSLIQKQKSGEIVIQKTDKGGGIAIMNRIDYVNKIEKEHLNSVVTLSDGSKKKVYREVDRISMKFHYYLMKSSVKDALEEKVIDEETAKFLVPREPKEGRAYGMVKAHKDTPVGEKLPPMRLVVSGCGSTTENISHFVDFFSKEIPEKLDSHIKDTPHLLRMLENLNQNSSQPENALLVSIDVVGLYPNIPQDEGMAAFKEYIKDPEYRDQTIPSSLLMTFLRYVLSFNSFVFDGKLYLQCWGTAIGTKVAPTYATIFMASLEKKLLAAWRGQTPELWKRFLDDVISVWHGTKDELLNFIKFLNDFHPTIKFTAEFRTYTHQVKVKFLNGQHIVNEDPLGELKPRSIDFLDTTIYINREGKFVTDLFKKSSDRITYLLPSSNHPDHICRNIPYSLGYRLRRICSRDIDFQIRLNELSSNLQSRGYGIKVIKNAFKKLKKVTREKALEKVVKDVKSKDITFTVTYDPRTNHPPDIIKKHYLIASHDPTFRENFPNPPRVAYRRTKNLGEILMRSKLYEVNDNGHNLREKFGFTKCNSRDVGCQLCLKSANSKQHKSAKKMKVYDIKTLIRCTDEYVIYSIECKKCPSVQYVGQTSQTIRNRFYSHLHDVRGKNQMKPVSKHFSLRGHTENDMIFSPFEKLRTKDKTMLNVREKYWIDEKQPNLNILV